MRTFERQIGDRTFFIEEIIKWTGRTYRKRWQWCEPATGKTSETFRLKGEAVRSALREAQATSPTQSEAPMTDPIINTLSMTVWDDLRKDVASKMGVAGMEISRSTPTPSEETLVKHDMLDAREEYDRVRDLEDRIAELEAKGAKNG